MLKRSIVAAMIAVFTFSSAVSGQERQVIRGADIEATQPDPDITPPVFNLTLNEQFVLHSLRTLFSAQKAFSRTAGVGNYGSLVALGQMGLIDGSLASGFKHGYSFGMSITYAGPQFLPTFTVIANPDSRGSRNLSFYMNENGDVRGGYGGTATISDPIVEAAGASQLTENEDLVMVSLRTIHSGEVTYAATIGAGNYGTLGQLFDAGIVTTGFAFGTIYRDYRVHSMTVVPASGQGPARFALSVVPHWPGRSGHRSFYIDETGVLRGANKNGEPADQTDPPINK